MYYLSTECRDVVVALLDAAAATFAALLRTNCSGHDNFAAKFLFSFSSALSNFVFFFGFSILPASAVAFPVPVLLLTFRFNGIFTTFWLGRVVDAVAGGITEDSHSVLKVIKKGVIINIWVLYYVFQYEKSSKIWGKWKN